MGLMGTNYYLHDNACEHCGRSDEPIHIGKSSAGWCFSLHVTDDIKSLADWKSILYRTGTQVIDEYGTKIPVHEMLTTIECRDWGYKKEKAPRGHKTWDEFHKENHSVFGPNGLLRHEADGRHCVGHGDGTYDYITGEFS